MAQHPPSVGERAFDCPHCGAYTSQEWYALGSQQIRLDDGTPGVPCIPDGSWTSLLIEMLHEKMIEETTFDRLKEWTARMQSGDPFFRESSGLMSNKVDNLFLSKCISCHRLTVWLHDRTIFPCRASAITPSED